MASKMIQYTQTSLKMLEFYIARLDSRHCLRSDFELDDLDDHPLMLPESPEAPGWEGLQRIRYIGKVQEQLQPLQRVLLHHLRVRQ